MDEIQNGFGFGEQGEETALLEKMKDDLEKSLWGYTQQEQEFDSEISKCQDTLSTLTYHSCIELWDVERLLSEM